jgi:hypothetical protein
MFSSVSKSPKLSFKYFKIPCESFGFVSRSGSDSNCSSETLPVPIEMMSLGYRPPWI